MTPEKQNEDRRIEDGWHLDKKVPLSLIFAMLVQAGMVLWAIADIKKDVEILKASWLLQRDRDNQQDRASTDNSTALRAQLDRIDSKLDRLIEKKNGL